MIDAGLVRRAVGTLGVACLLSVFAAPGSAAVPSSALSDGPVVGPEHPVSSPIDGASFGWQSSPSVAFDGTNHLVVWRDSRTYGSTGYDIYGARVAPDGRVLDPVGIPIATRTGHEASPRVAFGDGTFLVVWNTAGTPEIENDVVATRVTPSGAVLDPSGIPIASTPRNELGADVAFGAGRFLVVWTDEAAAGQPSDVYGTRVDPSGSVVAPSRLPISTAPGSQSQPTVGFGADNFLVAWTDGRVDPTLALYGARVRPSGTVLDPSGIAISTTSSYEAGAPAIAFNGTDQLVVWASYRTSRWGVFGARVGPSGAVLDPAGIAISRMTDAEPPRPTPTALGATILVAWGEYAPGGPADVLGARIDAGGANLDPSGFVIAGSVADHASVVGLGSDGSNWFAAWEDARMGTPHVFGAPIRPDGSVLGPGTLIPRSANNQGGSRLAFDGTNYLMVWGDTRAGHGQLFAVRLSPDGRRLDGADLPIAGAAGGGNPAVVFDGDHYVVAWTSSGTPDQVHVRYVSPFGYLEGPAVTLPGPPFPNGIDDLEIASGDSGILVTWSDYSRFGRGVRAVRLDRAGTVLDPAPLVLSEDGGSTSVASDGHDYLVVWNDFTMGRQSLRGTRITADGAMLDPTGFLIRAGLHAREPAVAWNGQRYLAVWSDSPTGDHFGLFGARVTGGGIVQDTVPLAISTGPRNERAPVVTANGPFLVAWRETDEAGVHDVRGARVTDDGTVLDRPGIPIATSDRLEGGVALTPGPGATWGATYTRFVREPPYGSNRVFLRSVSPK